MISRLPERFGLAEELIDPAIMTGNWTEIGTLSEGKNQKRILKLAGFDESIYSKTVRVKN